MKVPLFEFSLTSYNFCRYYIDKKAFRQDLRFKSCLSYCIVVLPQRHEAAHLICGPRLARILTSINPYSHQIYSVHAHARSPS